MALDSSLATLAADAVGDAITAVSLHSAAPVGGSNEVVGGGYARQTPAWEAGAAGVIDLSAPLSFSTPASQTVTHVGLWSGATWRGSLALSGDGAANAAGEYEVTSIELTVSVTP